MKKLLAVTIIVLLCIAALNTVSFDHPYAWGDWHVNVNGDEVEGPLGFLFGTLLAGGGLLVGFVALVCAALVVGLVCAGLFAGFGILAVVVLAVIAGAIALALAPLLLPLLALMGIIWYVNRRNRRAAVVKNAEV